MSIGLTGYLRPQSAVHRDATTKQPRLYGSTGAAGLRYSALPSVENLVAYYSLENNGNDAAGTHHLTPSGTVPYGSGKKWSGLVLDGAGHLSLTSAQALNPRLLSVSVWVNFTYSGINTGVLGMWPGASVDVGEYLLNIETLPGKLRFGVAIGGSLKNASLTVNVNTGTWRHIVGVHDQSTVKIYLDGDTQIVSSAAVGTRNNLNSNFDLGAIAGSSFRFNGAIDEVAIFNTSLSADGVLQLYNAGAGIFY